MISFATLIGGSTLFVGLVWILIAWLSKSSMLKPGRTFGFGILTLVWGMILNATGSSWIVTLLGFFVLGAILWGWQQEGAAQKPRQRARAITPSGSIPSLPSPGTYLVDVRGESNYQNNFAIICGPRSEDGEDRYVTALLSKENDNPVDPNAVRVDINGLQVGYLSKQMAVAFRQSMAEAGYGSVNVVSCNAHIRGGWQRRNGDIGHYGVWLDLPLQNT